MLDGLLREPEPGSPATPPQFLERCSISEDAPRRLLVVRNPRQGLGHCQLVEKVERDEPTDGDGAGREGHLGERVCRAHRGGCINISPAGCDGLVMGLLRVVPRDLVSSAALRESATRSGEYLMGR